MLRERERRLIIVEIGMKMLYAASETWERVENYIRRRHGLITIISWEEF